MDEKNLVEGVTIGALLHSACGKFHANAHTHTS